jgi:hypothetical protein
VVEEVCVVVAFVLTFWVMLSVVLTTVSHGGYGRLKIRLLVLGGY